MLVFVIDQLVASASNFFVVLTAARNETPAQFGTFSIVYGVLIAGLALRSATLGDLVLVTSGGSARAASIGLGCSVFSGFAVAGAAVAVGAVLGMSAIALVGVGAAAAILAQDGLRTAAFADRRPERALLLDGIWLTVQVVATIAIGFGNPNAPMMGWVSGALVATAYGMVTVRPELRPSVCLGWLRRSRGLVGPYAVQYALGAGVTQLLAALVAAGGRLSDAGAFRGALTLAGPYGICVSADRIDLLTQVQRGLIEEDLRRRSRQSVQFLTVVAALLLVLIVALPTSAGRNLLGSTWHSAADITPALLAVMWAASLPQAAQVRLTASLHSRATLAMKALTAAITLGGFAVLVSLGVSALHAALIALLCSALVGLPATAILAQRLAPLSALARPSSPDARDASRQVIE